MTRLTAAALAMVSHSRSRLVPEITVEGKTPDDHAFNHATRRARFRRPLLMLGRNGPCLTSGKMLRSCRGCSPKRDYLALNPLGQPSLHVDDGETKMTESLHLSYLGTRHGPDEPWSSASTSRLWRVFELDGFFRLHADFSAYRWCCANTQLERKSAATLRSPPTSPNVFGAATRGRSCHRDAERCSSCPSRGRIVIASLRWPDHRLAPVSHKGPNVAAYWRA